MRRAGGGASRAGHDLKQDFAQLHHGLGAPVVAAHELLAGALGQAAPRVKAVFIAKSGGHGSLPLEHQPVFVPPGQQVQARANQPQQPLIARQLPRLARRGHAAGQIGPAAPETGRARHPADGVQIAQAAGRLLAIRLQRVGRVLLPGVALALLELLGRQKSQRIELRGKSDLKAGQQRRIARHPARFQPGRAGGDVLPRRLQTLRHGAHAVAHLQAHIPAGGHEGRYRRVQRSWRPGLIRQQYQHIHVRKRKQLAAPVAAHRRQRPRQARAPPQGGQRFIGQAGQRRHRARQARSRRCGQGARPHVIQQRLALAAVARAQGGQRVSRWIGGRAGFGSRSGHGRA